MEVIPGGCSSGNVIDKLDCRNRPEFDNAPFLAYCPKSKGRGFSIEECNSKCLELESCAIYQRAIESNGVCWFYGSPDLNGSNGGEENGWECGVKKCPKGKR